MFLKIHHRFGNLFHIRMFLLPLKGFSRALAYKSSHGIGLVFKVVWYYPDRPPSIWRLIFIWGWACHAPRQAALIERFRKLVASGARIVSDIRLVCRCHTWRIRHMAILCDDRNYECNWSYFSRIAALELSFGCWQTSTQSLGQSERGMWMGKGGKGGQLSWWERDGESSLCQKVAAIFDLTWRRVGESGRHGVRQSGSQGFKESKSRGVEALKTCRVRSPTSYFIDKLFADCKSGRKSGWVESLIRRFVRRLFWHFLLSAAVFTLFGLNGIKSF